MFVNIDYYVIDVSNLAIAVARRNLPQDVHPTGRNIVFTDGLKLVRLYGIKWGYYNGMVFAHPIFLGK